MKNNSPSFIKSLFIINALFFFSLGLKADKNQENIKSDISTFKKNLEETSFDMSEKLMKFECLLKCSINSNFPEICKLKCEAQSLNRIMAFKFKKLSNTIRS